MGKQESYMFSTPINQHVDQRIGIGIFYYRETHTP